MMKLEADIHVDESQNVKIKRPTIMIKKLRNGNIGIEHVELNEQDKSDE